MQGFKEFILRGNLIELAVAFIMGTAFAKVIEAFTGVLMGFIGMVGGELNFDGVELLVVNVGVFLTQQVSFSIIAAVVDFFVVTPYYTDKERFFDDKPEASAPKIVLPPEIRDTTHDRGG